MERRRKKNRSELTLGPKYRIQDEHDPSNLGGEKVIRMPCKPNQKDSNLVKKCFRVVIKASIPFSNSNISFG